MQFQFLGLVGLMGLIVQPVLAGPIRELMCDVDAKPDTFQVSSPVNLGGYHRASVYNSEVCSGQPIMDVENFGCGGQCHPLSYGYSIFLRQETLGNPKPTASLFYSTDCTGAHTSAGIWSGQLSGCTKNPSNQGWRSVYLYYNC